jgi:hypothetical protein
LASGIAHLFWRLTHNRTLPLPSLPSCLLADAYKVTEESTVVLAAPSPPLIKLDDKHYK